MRVEVLEYDSNWPALFEKEKALLLENFGAAIVRVHHIGSTSVYGLSAKPVIDIMLEVNSLDELDDAKARFEALGYEVKGEFGIARRRYFQKGGYNRTHQIHAFVAGDEHVIRHLAFRDYLKAHPHVRLEYQDLKIKVASECNDDIEGYCDGKDGFVKHHEAKALEWMAAQGRSG